MSRFLNFVFCALVLGLYACAPTPTATAIPPSPSASPPHLTPTSPPTIAFVEATPNTPLNVRGMFVYSPGDGSLWMQDARGGDPTPFVERSTESIAQLLAFSPDGTRVVYSALLILPDGNSRGDVRMIDVNGKNSRTALGAQANDEVYFYPRFARDGRLLLTHAENLQTANERASLEWLDVQNGKTTRVMENARDADVSPNGKQIAFVRVDVATMRSGLWIANADGTSEQ